MQPILKSQMRFDSELNDHFASTLFVSLVTVLAITTHNYR